MEKQTYAAPDLKLVEVKVERGFVATLEDPKQPDGKVDW